ncbi:MAG: 50S ribosomal protein L15 [Oscillospiraceae bacterium]|nr:50S ribosomal protein L15 [Oscillospiraceae bacterium]
MNLHEFSPAAGSRRQAKRKGRGAASGNGKTAGKGHKGQNARTGGGVRPGFEGGQMPLYRRLPKRGFTNVFSRKYAVLNVADLEERFNDGDTIDKQKILEVGLLKKTLSGIKILGTGEISKKLQVRVAAFSRSAVQKIEAAGGRIEVV